MIAFHISFMLLAIIGLIISVNAFPSAYGKKWNGIYCKDIVKTIKNRRCWFRFVCILIIIKELSYYSL
jgi:ABC-type methionine transport system permease subunit